MYQRVTGRYTGMGIVEAIKLSYEDEFPNPIDNNQEVRKADLNARPLRKLTRNLQGKEREQIRLGHNILQQILAIIF